MYVLKQKKVCGIILLINYKKKYCICEISRKKLSLSIQFYKYNQKNSLLNDIMNAGKSDDYLYLNMLWIYVFIKIIDIIETSMLNINKIYFLDILGRL